MRYFICSTGLVMAAMVAGPTLAAGHPEVDDWNNFCLSTRGDPTRALAKAEALGWKPQANFAPSPEQFEFEQSRQNNDGPDRHNLLVLRHKPVLPDGSGLHLVQCLAGYGNNADDPVPAVTALLGFKPNTFDGKVAEWVLQDVDGKLVQLPNDDTARADKAFADHSAIMVHATVEDGVAMVSYEAPKPSR